MGEAGESRMTVHQQKKLDVDALLEFRDRFALPLADADVGGARVLSAGRSEPRAGLPARAARGAGRRTAGAAPARRHRRRPGARQLRAVRPARRRQGDVDDDGRRAAAQRAAEGQDARARASCRSSPTRRARSAWRACSGRSASIRRRASSTSPRTPARCSTTARRATGSCSRKASRRRARCRRGPRRRRRTACTAQPMLPFYIYYSMFGFQRVGDLIWAAADQRARGFLLGATAGRTTLGGEGLQHQDGSSHRDRRDVQLPRLRSRVRVRARGDPRSRHAADDGASRSTSSTTSP